MLWQHHNLFFVSKRQSGWEKLKTNWATTSETIKPGDCNSLTCGKTLALASQVELLTEMSFSVRWIALYFAITQERVDILADHLVSHSFGTCLLTASRTSLSVSSCSLAASPTTMLAISSSFRYCCKMLFVWHLPPQNQARVPRKPNEYLISGTLY